ncbi:MAG: two-component regulator propeller domain-containing protein, partial [Planctomycetota bacterium]
MIAPESSRPDPGQPSPDHLLPERVRQVHAVCLLLNAESKPAARSRPSVQQLATTSERPHGFARVVTALALLLTTTVGTSCWWWSRPTIHRVADYRIGVNYEQAEATDAVLSTDGRYVLLGTAGGGLHRFDARSRFLQQHTAASTHGGLLSDDVRRIDRDAQGRLYFLCQKDDHLGLCRATDKLDQWSTLLGVERFAALDVPEAEREVSATVMNGTELWIGTRSDGIGRYEMRDHAWQEPITASADGLLDNRVRDLVSDPDGVLWIATAAGINRYDPPSGVWQRFTATDVLAGTDVVRLRWLDDALWYVTAEGGLGRLDRTGGTVLIRESGWGRYENQDVAAVASDPQSRLWFATHKGDVGRYDPEHRQWFDVGSSPATGKVRVLAAPVQPDATVWLGTEHELLRWKLPEGDTPGTWQVALPSGVDQLDVQGPSVVARLTPGTDRPFAAVSTSEVGTNWQTVVGGRALHDGARTISAAAFDSEQQRLWVATERGLASYDTQSNDWVGDFPLAAAATSRLTDIRLTEGAAIVLGTDREIRRLQLLESKWESLLGGGKIEAAESEITAVTRDVAGRLWVGTKSQGLFVYDPSRHRWEPRLPFSKPVDVLQASTGMVWLVSQGEVYTVAADRIIQPLSAKLPEVVALTAAPHAPAAVLRCRTGHVFLTNDQRQVRTLVGDAAPGWDPTTALVVGVLNEWVVFGGDRPHLYDQATRSWQPLSVGAVAEIVPALGALWLRTGTGVVRLAADRKLEPMPQTESVIRLAGTKEQLVALSKEGVIRVRKKDVADWVTLNEAPNGPKASLLQEPNWSAACVGDGLYLSGGKDGDAWFFSWITQQWQPVNNSAGPLKRVLQLLSGGNRVFALEQGGLLYESQVGAAAMVKGLSDVIAAQAASDVVVATTKNGSVNLRRDDGWHPILGQATQQPLGAPRRAVAALGGMVFAGTEGTSWLSENLNDWREMAVPKGMKLAVEEFRSSEDGRALWAISTQRRLFAFDVTAWSWKDLLPDNLTVESTTVVGLPDKTSELWVCTQDGAVYRVRGEKATLWSQPSAAPGQTADIVGMVAVPNGFLAAFAPGRLAFFSALTRTWTELPSPAGKQRFVELVALGAGAEGCGLLRTQNGGLYRSPLAASPAWVAVATGVSNLSLQSSVAWAVTGPPASVIQIAPKGAVRTVVAASGWAETKNGGTLTAACEVALDDGGTGLALGFTTHLAIYNPATHIWRSQSVPVKALTPIAGGLLVQDSRGQVTRAFLKANEITLEPLGKDTRAVVTTSTASGPTWVALQEDGAVSRFDGAKLVEQWVGRAWSGNPAQTRIGDFTALGQWFFFLDQNGRLHAYDRLARDWQTMDDVSAAKRLAAGENCLWVEKTSANESQLLRLTPQGKTWTVKTAAEGVVRWQAGPGGVLIVARQNGRLQEAVLRENGGTVPVSLTVPPGPDEQDIVGARLQSNQIWLRTSRGTLWNYRPDTRRWTEFPLDPKAAVETVRFAAERVWAHEVESGLWMGQADPTEPSGWRFTAALPSIKAFDVAADLIATTGSQVVVRDPQADSTAVPKATRDFSSRAWIGDSDRLSRLAARNDALLTVTQSNAAARYRLTTRQWDALPPLPVIPVDLFALPQTWCVVGSKEELLRLRNDQWEVVTARSEMTWRDATSMHTIDAQGRWVMDAAAPPVDQPVTPRIATTATPVRVYAASHWLLLELSDGSLWRYDAAAQELLRLVAPAATGRKRTGLVTAAKLVFFVAEDDRQACSLVADTGQLTPIALPEALSSQTWTPLVHAEGLVLAAPQLGALVQNNGPPELLEAAALVERKSQSKPVDAVRHRQSGRWRVSGENASAPQRLECQFHTDWKPVPIDYIRSRIGWDVATGGLTVAKQIVLATAAGVVIHSAQERGLPIQFLPIDWSTGVTPGGRIWSLSADQCVVRAYGGRKWLLNMKDSAEAVLEPYAVPSSQWSITRDGENISFRANFGGGEPLPLRIDKNGRLDCDTATSVASFEDSAWIATSAGLFEYSPNLRDLKDVKAFGPCDVLVSADRKRLFARLGDGSLVVKDGSKWTPTTAKWSSLVAESRLTERLPGAPLEWELNLGRNRPMPQKVRYVGRALSIDSTMAPKSLATEATDGIRVYTLTAEGLVLRTMTGEWIGLLRLENAAGLAWIHDPDHGRMLVVMGAAGRGWRMENTTAIPMENVTDLLKPQRLSWQGRVWQGDLQEGGQRVELRSGTDLVEVLDLKKRGFLRDQLLTVHWDGTAAWLIGPTRIECRIGNGAPLFRANPLIGSPRVVQAGSRSWLTDDKQILELKADGSIGSVLSLADNLPEERAAASALWRGPSWRVVRRTNPAGLAATIEYRNASDQWLRGELNVTDGLSWDQFVAAGAEGDALAVSTRAGDYAIEQPINQMGLALATWRPISQPAESTTVAMATTQFWTDAAGQLWKNRAGSWLRYESAGPKWSPVSALPTDQQVERQTLSRAPRSEWVKTTTGVEYVEFDPDRQPVRSTLSPEGVLPSAFVRAVLPHGKSQWLLTRQDLRQVDDATGELLRVAADAADVTRGEFRATGTDWFLRLHRGMTDHVFRLGDRGWEPINSPANPFAPLAQESVLGLLRVRPAASGLTTELRESKERDRWHPVAFLPAANRFDFQFAQNAISDGQRSLTKTPVGVAAWRFVENQWRLVSLQPAQNAISAPAASRRWLAGGPENRWEEWDAQGEWRPSVLTEEEVAVIARSDRWTVKRSAVGHGEIGVRASKKEPMITALALDSRGDFEFRRPWTIATTSDGAVWTASRASLSRFDVVPRSNRAPAFVATVGSLPDKPVTDLFVIDHAVHAAADGKLIRFDAQRGWESVPDRAVVEAQRQQLVEGEFWSWTRAANGRLAGVLKIDDAMRLTPKWDVATGRFQHDQVQFAVPVAQAVWLSHPAGLSRLSLKNGRLDISLTMSTAPRLVEDRQLGAWLVETTEAPSRFAKLEWDAAKAELIALGDQPPLVAGPNDRFLDAEWRFATSDISWRGMPTRLIEQHFAHDHYQSLASSSQNLVTATPAGMIVWDPTRSPWSIVAAIPPPIIDADWAIDVDETQVLRAIDRKSQRRFEWKLPEGPWRQVGAGETARTLVDTPRWTWQQDLQGQIAMRLHAAEQSVKEPIVSRDGRFLWDDVAAVLCDGDEVWTGGRNGIVRRSLTDGEPRRWYQSGLVGDQSRPLAMIVRLGRFDPEGVPILSWDRPERVASATIMALDEKNEAWRFDGPREAGRWRHVSENPWSVTGGLRRFRHPLVESILDVDGKETMRYTAGSPTAPVLHAGRLLIDTVRDIALSDDGQLMLATQAGVVR